MFALVSVITVSVQAAFLHREAAVWAINYVLDIFFYADMWEETSNSFSVIYTANNYGFTIVISSCVVYLFGCYTIVPW